MAQEKWLKQFKNTLHFKDLNSSQQEAIELSYKKNGLVIAGAGTGKTKTLITRIIALIQTKVFEPQEIVALTFTNKAALEMKERLEKIINEKAALVNIGTFHSFALALIKEDLKGFGFESKIHLLDEKQQFDFIKKLFIENHWDSKNKAEEKLLTYINEQKEKGIRSFKAQAKTKKGIKILNNQYKIYEESLKKKNYLDFSELVLLLKERLEKDLEYKQILQSRFKTYLVDEFQDTNPLQYQTILLLTEDKSSIFAVGDDCQSIYSFRGAEVKNILEFEKKCKENEEKDGVKSVIKLEQNYRSSSNVVEISNKFISHAKERIEKNLWTDNPPSSKIYVYKAYNEYQEAKFIVDTIEEKLTENKYKDFAVIYRGNNQSAKIETLLSLKKIPYKVSGGMSFLQKPEIKTLMACLILLVYKDDPEAIARVASKILYPKIDKKIFKNWDIEAEQEKQDLSELILKRKTYQFPLFEKFFHFIKLGVEEFKYSTMKESVEMYLTNIGFYKSFDNDKNKENKLNNIESFLNEIENYENQGGESFANFIYRLTQTANTESKFEKDVVNLMTIHSSKGLEFKHVFLIGLEDGVIPSTHAIEENNIEEELRLMYVGMTRAKKTLYFSFCENRFNGYEYVSYLPTRFFYFLDENYLQPINTTWLPEPLPYFFIENDLNKEHKDSEIRENERNKFKANHTEEDIVNLYSSISKSNPLFKDILNKIEYDNCNEKKCSQKSINLNGLKTPKEIEVIENIEESNIENTKQNNIENTSLKNISGDLKIVKEEKDLIVGNVYLINQQEEEIIDLNQNEYGELLIKTKQKNTLKINEFVFDYVEIYKLS